MQVIILPAPLYYVSSIRLLFALSYDLTGEVLTLSGQFYCAFDIQFPVKFCSVVTMLSVKTDAFVHHPNFVSIFFKGWQAFFYFNCSVFIGSEPVRGTNKQSKGVSQSISYMI